jgi:hypothetical protein
MAGDLDILQITSLEPGRSFLGRISFDSAKTGIQSSTLIVKSFNLSQTTSNKIEVRRMAEVAYYPGNIDVEPLTLTVYFFKDQLMEFLKAFYKKVYRPSQGTLGAAKDIKSDVILEVLKPDGTPAKTIKLQNAWIHKVDLGQINWASNEIITATISLRYDKVISVN